MCGRELAALARKRRQAEPKDEDYDNAPKALPEEENFKRRCSDVFDETNKTEEQEMELPEKLFESNEISEEESFDDNHTVEEEAETLTIKYNGEEKRITLDEARILAQKGMNYDHVVAERDTKYKRELDFLDKVAEREGLTRTQYMEREGSLQEVKETENPNLMNDRERAAAQIRRITDSLGMTGPWSELFKKYPTLSRSEAYGTLSESVAGGMTPIEAYQEKLIAEKDNLLRMARENGVSARKSVGSLGGDGGHTHRDEFLEGFSMYD